ncbi:MAG: hypothetical protein WKF92_05660 [Pyrinomonadaceae bacterium]
MRELKSEKTEPGRYGNGLESKTYFTDGENNVFSNPNSNTGLDHIAEIIERTMRPGKVVRLYRCFACNGNFSASKLSTTLVLCRECLKQSKGKGRIARSNQIDRIANNFRIFLRGRLESI